MLLTTRIGSAAMTSPRARALLPRGRRARRLRLAVAGFGARRPAGVLLDIGFGGLVEQRLHPVAGGGDRVGDLDPFRAVPLLDEGRAMAVMVGATQLERRGE